MSEDPNATRISGGMEDEPMMDPEIGEDKKNNRNIIIAVVAVVVLCCCCSAAASAWWAFSTGQFNF